MKQLDDLMQEFRGLKDRSKHGQISAEEYLRKIEVIAQKYINILDSLATPEVLEVPAR